MRSGSLRPDSRLFHPVALALLLSASAHGRAGDDAGPLVRSLWLVQRVGTRESVGVHNDQKVKGALSKALGKEGALTAAGVRGLLDFATFAKLAGDDGRLDAAE